MFLGCFDGIFAIIGVSLVPCYIVVSWIRRIKDTLAWNDYKSLSILD